MMIPLITVAHKGRMVTAWEFDALDVLSGVPLPFVVVDGASETGARLAYFRDEADAVDFARRKVDHPFSFESYQQADERSRREGEG